MTAGVCCPLSECDESADVYRDVVRVARRAHQCCECSGDIPRGARYEDVVLLQDGDWSRWRTCLLCCEIRKHFACGAGWFLGILWQDLEDNFFPEMRAGGPCMEGLSADAKAMLFERRTAWLPSTRRWNGGGA